MFMSKELGYILILIYITIVALPFGVLMGLLTNYTLKRLLNEPEWKAIPVMLDAAMGVVGFIIGTFVSFIGYRINETHVGDVVYRNNTGFGDYHFLIANVGAVIFAAATHLAVKTLRDKRKKKNNPLENLE